MNHNGTSDDFVYEDAAPCPYAQKYLWPTVVEVLNARFPERGRIFEVGCGNGSAAEMLRQLGWEVTGVDMSDSGIAVANRAHPGIKLEVGSAYDDLAERYGRFPVVVSLEVVEHCYYPRQFAKCVFDLLEDGGTAIISTPYHGYLKNLLIALSGQMDHHFSPLWDGGHIKFWSLRTMTALLKEVGFEAIEYRRVGRVPVMAMSMIAVARKPLRASSRAASGPSDSARI